MVERPGSRHEQGHWHSLATGPIFLSVACSAPHLRRPRLVRAGAEGLCPRASGRSAIGTRTPSPWRVEAARDALTGWTANGSAGVSLASTSLPFADRLNAGMVKEALNLERCRGRARRHRQPAGRHLGAHPRAQGCGGRRRTSAVRRAEMRKAPPGSEAELINGDAAAALLVGGGKAVAKFSGRPQRNDRFRRPFPRRRRRVRLRLGGPLGPRRRLYEDRGQGDQGRSRGRRPRRRRHRSLRDRHQRARGARGGGEGGRASPEAVVEPLAPTSASRRGASAAHAGTRASSRRSPARRSCVVGFGQGLDVLMFEATRGARAICPPGWASAIARAPQAGRELSALSLPSRPSPLERGMRAENDEKTARHDALSQPQGGAGAGRRPLHEDRRGAVPENRHQRRPRMTTTIGTQEDYPLAETPRADRHLHRRQPDLFARSAGLLRHDRVRGRRPHDGRIRRLRAPRMSRSGAIMRMVFRIKAVDETAPFQSISGRPRRRRR